MSEMGAGIVAALNAGAKEANVLEGENELRGKVWPQVCGGT